jgi:hemerythrin superfamily protein
MARSTGTSKRGRKSSSARGGQRAASRRGDGRRSGTDAISLLKSDHREVEDLFEQFEKARSEDRKSQIAQQICNALKAHTTIEEEIFYPAFLQATEETDIHHEAEIEHEGAKRLVAEIEGMSADDEYYDAKVTVLSEMIKHHVNEEEKRGGMFAKARQSDMDLDSLGQQLQQRKSEVMGESQTESDDGGSSRRGGVAGALLGRNNRGRQADARRG